MTTIASGTITWADLRTHWEAELAEGGEPYPELVDCCEAQAGFDAADVRRLVALVEAASRVERLGPTAIVVNSDVGFGMMRMLGMLLEPHCQVQPFRDRASAETWLARVGKQEGEGVGG